MHLMSRTLYVMLMLNEYRASEVPPFALAIHWVVSIRNFWTSSCCSCKRSREHDKSSRLKHEIWSRKCSICVVICGMKNDALAEQESAATESAVASDTWNTLKHPLHPTGSKWWLSWSSFIIIPVKCTNLRVNPGQYRCTSGVSRPKVWTSAQWVP